MVPEGWERQSLGDLLEFKNGFNTEKANYGHGTPFINVSEVLKHESLTADLIPGQVSVTGKELSANSVVHGDILFNRTSETTDEVGFTAVYLDTVPVIFGGFVIRGRPTNGSLHPEFTKYALRQPSVRSEIIRRSQGAVRSNIGQGELSKVEVALPPLPEQRKIADILSTWDAAIEKTEALLATAKAQKRALMQSLLTGKRRFPEFESQPWKDVRLGEAEENGWLKLNRGKVISKKDIAAFPGEYPIYSSSVVGKGEFGRYAEHMFDEELITWSVDGGGHFFHRKRHKFSVTNVCGWMRVDTNIINYAFMAAQLQFLHQRLQFDYQSKAHPSVIRNIYDIVVPSLPEQQAIGRVAADCDNEIQTLENDITRLRTEKKALMQQLLTGKRRVSV